VVVFVVPPPSEGQPCFEGKNWGVEKKGERIREEMSEYEYDGCPGIYEDLGEKKIHRKFGPDFHLKFIINFERPWAVYSGPDK
jgi:hypothetical protein